MLGRKFRNIIHHAFKFVRVWNATLRFARQVAFRYNGLTSIMDMGLDFWWFDCHWKFSLPALQLPAGIVHRCFWAPDSFATPLSQTHSKHKKSRCTWYFTNVNELLITSKHIYTIILRSHHCKPFAGIVALTQIALDHL